MEPLTEEQYEYDAPKHFIDFQNMSNLDEDDGADQWFDEHSDGTFEDAFLSSATTLPPSEPPTAIPQSEQSSVVPHPPKTDHESTPTVKTEDNGMSAEVGKQIQKEAKDLIPVGRETFVVNKNVGSPVITLKPKTFPETSQVSNTAAQISNNTPSNDDHLPQATAGDSSEKNMSTIENERNKLTKEFYGCVKHMPKANKVVPIIKQKPFKPLNRPHREAARKAISTIHSILTPKKRTPKKATSAQVRECQNPGLVKEREVKPSHSSVPRAPQTKKTYEDLQMEEVQRLKKDVMKRLRQSRRSFASLTKSSGPVVVKGSMPTTEPVEFKFHQTTREKKGQVVKTESNSVVHPQQFFSSLRSSRNTDKYNPNVPTTKPPTPSGGTKVKPFKFHLDDRLGHKQHNTTVSSQSSTSSHGPDVPMAEAIAKYQKATPPRFRRTIKKPPSARKSCVTDGLTVPKTPNLSTKARTRPVNIKSAAMEEEEEMENIKQHKFKANPLNPAIFNMRGMYGVPQKRQNAGVTLPQSPMLTINKRMLEKKEDTKNVDSEETEVAFHARPMPNFEKVMLPTKRALPLTHPESPALCLKRRRLHEDTEDEEEKKEVGFKFKSNPLPDFDNVFKPLLGTKKTEPAPFSFEERDKDKPNRETFVEMILRKEKHPNFRAQRLPDFSSGPLLPPKPTPSATKVQPFNLKSETRGQEYEHKWLEKMEKESEKAKEAAEFKAHDAKVLYTKPFQPQQSKRPLTDTDDVILSTEVRGRQRAVYDANLQLEALKKENDNLRRKALREIQEKREVTEYRKTLVHKAQPINEYAPVVIHPSDKLPTLPISPHFRTESRLR